MACSCDNDRVFSVSATNGEKSALLLTNLGEETIVQLNEAEYTAYLIDEDNTFEKMDVANGGFAVKQYQTVYIEL